MSDDTRDEMARLSRRSLLWAGAALIGGYGGFRFLGTRRSEDGIPWPFRRALELNESVWSDLFSERAMAPTFDPSLVRGERVNGMLGLSAGFDPAAWRLRVEGASGAATPLSFSLEDIQAMPRREFTTQLCCIEGWSILVTWAGVRLSDFMRLNPPPDQVSGQAGDIEGGRANLPRYVYMETPDGGYYVGLDLASALHPQTLLCYEMNGKPLTAEHGAPLRLVIPTKYGIKNLKRIGLIRYTDQRPRDYWAERGYDWYAGL